MHVALNAGRLRTEEPLPVACESVVGFRSKPRVEVEAVSEENAAAVGGVVAVEQTHSFDADLRPLLLRDRGRRQQECESHDDQEWFDCWMIELHSCPSLNVCSVWISKAVRGGKRQPTCQTLSVLIA